MRREACFLSTLCLLIGCGGEPLPAPEAPQSPEAPGATKASVAPETAEEAAPCASKEACYEAGRLARDAKDAATAAILFTRGCDLDGADSCVALGSAVGKEDKKRSVELNQKACDLGSGDGCFNAAESSRERDPHSAAGLYLKACEAFAPEGGLKASLSCSRGAMTAYGAGEHKAALTMAERSCTEKMRDGCNVMGVLYSQGKGAAQDIDRAKEAFHKGCEAGDSEACDNEKKLDAALAAEKAKSAAIGGLDVPNANITIGSVTADGLTLRDFSCRAEGGGLGAILAGPTMAGALAKKKGALKACAPKGEDVRVRFQASGGRVSQVEAKASSAAVEACVKKALTGSVATIEGTCAATIALGH